MEGNLKVVYLIGSDICSFLLHHLLTIKEANNNVEFMIQVYNGTLAIFSKSVITIINETIKKIIPKPEICFIKV